MPDTDYQVRQLRGDVELLRQEVAQVRNLLEAMRRTQNWFVVRELRRGAPKLTDREKERLERLAADTVPKMEVSK